MLQKMKMGTKLSIAFLLVITVAVVIGAVSVVSIQRLKASEDKIFITRMPGIMSLSVINEAMASVRSAENAFMDIVNIKDKRRREFLLEEIESKFKTADEAWKKYEKLEHTEDEKAEWLKFEPLWNEWKKAHSEYVAVLKIQFDKIDSGMAENDPSMARIENEKDKIALRSEGVYFTADESLEKLVDINEKNAAGDDGVFDAIATNARLTMFFAISLGVVFSISLCVYFTRNINGIIRQLLTEAKKLADAAVYGRLNERGDVEKTNFEFRGIVRGINETLDSLVGHIDAMPAPALIVDNDLTIQYMNKTGADIIGLSQGRIIGTKCFNHFKTSDCNTERCACVRAIRDGRVSTSETDAHPGGKDLDISYTGVPIKDREGKIVGALEIVTDMTAVKMAARLSDKISAYQEAEVKKLVGALGEMARGNLRFDLTVAEGDKDTEETRKAFDNINDNLKQCAGSLKGLLDETGGLIQAVKDKRLDRRGDAEKFQGGYAELVEGVNTILDAMNDSFLQVVDAVSQVTSAAEQINAGSQAVAEGAAEQASSLEEITSSLEEMASMTKQNAANAGQAQSLAKEAFSSTDHGNKEMERMNGAIEDIKKSADQTAKIIKTIDEIAFQTNLLALNAAVEAARAGEAGKGFAVVAEEVRNLAQRSAEAAKNTAAMIEASVKNADNGVKIVNDVASILKEIGGSTEKVNNLVREIALASKEQSQGIEQVNTAMGQLDKVTQANSSSAEESASAAEELSSQAMLLSEMVGAFTLAGFSGGSTEAQAKTPQHALLRHAPLLNLKKSGNGNGNGSKKGKALTGGAGNKREQQSSRMPSAMIPLEDDEDFKEF